MRSDDTSADRLMGWCFVLLGMCLLALAVYFWLRGYLPGRGGQAILAGTLRFVVIELVLVCVGVMGLVAGRYVVQRNQ